MISRRQCAKPIMSKEAAIDKMQLFFDAFQEFKDDAYNIDNVVFEIKEETPTGMAFAEGVLKYDALLEKGESIHLKGLTNSTCKWKIIIGISFILLCRGLIGNNTPNNRIVIPYALHPVSLDFQPLFCRCFL